MRQPKCDFCGCANPVLRFECQDFVLQISEHDPLQELRGDWYSCLCCADVVEKKDKVELGKHVIGRKRALEPEWWTKADVDFYLDMLTKMYEGFYRNANGLDPKPIKPTDLLEVAIKIKGDEFRCHGLFLNPFTKKYVTCDGTTTHEVVVEKHPGLVFKFCERCTRTQLGLHIEHGVVPENHPRVRRLPARASVEAN